MALFSRPAAAISTILALTTSRYGDVYRLLLASSSLRSAGESSMTNGDLLGTCSSLSWIRNKVTYFIIVFMTGSASQPRPDGLVRWLEIDRRQLLDLGQRQAEAPQNAHHPYAPERFFPEETVVSGASPDRVDQAHAFVFAQRLDRYAGSSRENSDGHHGQHRVSTARARVTGRCRCSGDPRRVWFVAAASRRTPTRDQAPPPRRRLPPPLPRLRPQLPHLHLRPRPVLHRQASGASRTIDPIPRDDPEGEVTRKVTNDAVGHGPS